MKIYETDSAKEFERLAEEWTEERLIIHSSETPCVWTGQLATLNIAACKEHGFEIGKGRYLGGTIVCFPGDLSLCEIHWGNSDFAPNVVNRAAEWLLQKGINITFDNNDVLADGKKVISWARATTIEGWVQSVVHFSIGKMDLELVKAICTKPMAKIPGALSEYGITAEEISKEIEPLLEGEG